MISKSKRFVLCMLMVAASSVVAQNAASGNDATHFAKLCMDCHDADSQK
ncbi:MAG: hypothetical protein ACI8W8_001948, partial [Rhodothermales bacterium]